MPRVAAILTPYARSGINRLIHQVLIEWVRMTRPLTRNAKPKNEKEVQNSVATFLEPNNLKALLNRYQFWLFGIEN